MKRFRLAILIQAMFLSVFLLSACSTDPQGEYRNIAQQRAVLQSSSFDFDQTSQLVTDGIRFNAVPVFTEMTLNGRPVPKSYRESGFDDRYWTLVPEQRKDFSYEFRLDFNGIVLTTDEIVVKGQLKKRNSPKAFAAPCRMMILGTRDGVEWDTLYTATTHRYPDFYNESRCRFQLEKKLEVPYEGKSFRLVFYSSAVEQWQLGTWNFYHKGELQDVIGELKPFRSYWMSEDAGPQWLQMDLGALSVFDKMVFAWMARPTTARVLASEDGRCWKSVAACDFASDTLRLASPARGRYVRLEMDGAADGRYTMLSEWEVWGSNALIPAESHWTVERAGDTHPIPALVPGTVLSSYRAAGAVPDPLYADNNLAISDSYFKSDFIYRGQLDGPAHKEDERVYLNFDGINWKADVSLNGTALEPIEGICMPTRYDVTQLVREGKNEVVVRIHPPAHPGYGKQNTLLRDAKNGGVLGRDNPTFHASIGWDWMMTVHGRNMGIWNDVFFSTGKSVDMADLWVHPSLNLPDTTRAEVRVSALLVNRSDKMVIASLQGTFGTQAFASDPVRLEPGSSRTVSAKLTVEQPRLWWPNGYGEPYLYEVCCQAVADGIVSLEKSLRCGIRQMRYDTSDGRLTLYVNGRRFVGRGGNWGFSEMNLQYRAKDYDLAVALHKGENFTMIRNWVGQTLDAEFFEACDRHGIMVWQDFWLANPGDGPEPDDESLFMRNAEQLVKMTRNHPCIALYCGRNEGNPPKRLNEALEQCVKTLDEDVIYIPHSAAGWVSGLGLYHRERSAAYFQIWGQDRLHSERGMPCVPNYESLRLFLPEDKLWPPNELWGYHDFASEGAQKLDSFNDAVRSMLGEPQDAEQYCAFAQWVNYEGHRAMFEGRSARRRGLLLWMSHPAWPTFVWQQYDYWKDLTAGYYGCRKACEPLHIQWNPHTRQVEVVNVSAGARHSLAAVARVLDMYGKELSVQSCRLDSEEDSTVLCFRLEVPAGQEVYYYSLRLTDAAGSLLSENFYVQGRDEDNYQALKTLPKARVKLSVKADDSASISRGGSLRSYACTLVNNGETPAMMLHLVARSRKAATDRPGDTRILPVWYSDNYFHLMPGERKTVRVLLRPDDCFGEQPRVEMEGFNL